MSIRTSVSVRAFFVLAALSAANLALAQWVWVDEHGIKQFSDTAPPPNVPENHILKQPGHTGALPLPDTASNAPAAATPDKAPLTTAEQNAEFNKRKQEQADKAKKVAEEAKRQADKADNCTRSTNYLAGLKNGDRVSVTNAQGERSYLSDDERAREEARAQALIDTNCQ